MREWAHNDGLAWIFVFKTVLAALLSLLIAMRLDLPQPRTAMMTVFILMLPQSGMVIAKSFYRFCGTFVGLIVTLTLIALFAQQRVLFLVSMALWIGLCTAGAARNRNFKSYGFLLAGYTTALIGIPASQHPDGAFIAAMTRAAEVTLGIVCSSAVSALVFPQYAGQQMETAIEARFNKFIQYITRSLAGQTNRTDTESAISSFVADIVGFESIRSVAVFEKPDTRLKNGRLGRFNSEFMAVSTRFHALHQLVNRLRSRRTSATLEALVPYFRELSSLPGWSGQARIRATEATGLADALDVFRHSLSDRLEDTRSGLTGEPADSLLEFDTAAELLYRFVEDMRAYALTYASLAVPSDPRENWVSHYLPKTSTLVATISGLRAVVVTLGAAAFWIESAWPNGETLTMIAASTCAIVSSLPSPSRVAVQMAVGGVLAGVAGSIMTFALYPRLDGFILLATALAPFLMAGSYLITRKSVMGVGLGFCIFFSLLAGPDNVIQYDPSAYFDSAIALAAGIYLVAIAYTTFFPTSAPWLHYVLLRELRQQVINTTWHGLRRARLRFESGSRDLLWQLNAHSVTRPDLRKDSLSWFFSVLEVGHAILDLRLELREARNDRATQRLIKERSLERTLQAVARLFSHPSARNLSQALQLTDHAIRTLEYLLESTELIPIERQEILKMRSHLHFIRTALIEPESPFTKFLSPETSAAGK